MTDEVIHGGPADPPTPERDQRLAEEVRERAAYLREAMDAAADAGLTVEVSFVRTEIELTHMGSPKAARIFRVGFLPSVRVAREIEL